MLSQKPTQDLTEVVKAVLRNKAVEADAWACEGALADIEHLCRRELAKTKTTPDVTL